MAAWGRQLPAVRPKLFHYLHTDVDPLSVFHLLAMQHFCGLSTCMLQITTLPQFPHQIAELRLLRVCVNDSSGRAALVVEHACGQRAAVTPRDLAGFPGNNDKH